jgi:soluble lytic murein transglycosylase-like protein
VNEVNQSVGVCVPVDLVKALIYEESGGEMLEVNGAGYGGIMQVGIGSNCNHGIYDIYTIEGNVGCGVEHLAHGYQDCQTWEGTVTAYYAGHCIPNGAADDPALGGSGESDYDYQQKIISRWQFLDKQGSLN